MMAGLWCLVLVLSGCLLLQAVADQTRAKRLTTFGKSPPTNPPDKIPKGKECRNDSDCQTIEFTSCVPDRIDNKHRCLCQGNEAPINGECANKRRELHSKCHSDTECMYGAECTVNSTISSEKMCYCREGYVEENKTCNDGLARNAVVSLIVFSSLVLFIFSTN